MATERVMPRRLAPVLFALANIIIGASRLVDGGNKSYGLAEVPGSLHMWGVVFIIGGLLVLAGGWSRAVAWCSTFIMLGLWWLWADFVHQARAVYPQYVTVSGWVTPAVVGGLHALLAPYYRNAKRDLHVAGQ